MNCTCDDQRHDLRTALWHRAYCNWYDRRDCGQEFRAAAWGWLADRLVRFVPKAVVEVDVDFRLPTSKPEEGER